MNCQLTGRQRSEAWDTVYHPNSRNGKGCEGFLAKRHEHRLAAGFWLHGGSPLLTEVGNKFASVGLCEQARAQAAVVSAVTRQVGIRFKL